MLHLGMILLILRIYFKITLISLFAKETVTTVVLEQIRKGIHASVHNQESPHRFCYS